MLSSLWMSRVEMGGVFMTGFLRLVAGGAHISLPVAPLFVYRPIILHNTETWFFLRGSNFFWIRLFLVVPRFYLDVVGDNQVIQNLKGIDFADCETAIAEAVAGTRDLVAHGIMQNEDVSGQTGCCGSCGTRAQPFAGPRPRSSPRTGLTVR